MNDAAQTYILAAIASLRNEVVTRDDSTRGLVEARTDSLQTSIDEIKDHLKTLNGRTRKAEDSIARLNVVLFGIGAPVCLALLAAVLKHYVG